MSEQIDQLDSLLDNLSQEDFKQEVLEDFKIANISRQCSLIGRKEVLTGKAKFGIFGDGKEVAQIALSKFFNDGDWRSGYYRDQTWMFALDLCTPQQWFAQLYAHANLELEPHSAGRQMGGHFATRSIDQEGQWKDLTKMKNTSADISPIDPVGSQAPPDKGVANGTYEAPTV